MRSAASLTRRFLIGGAALSLLSLVSCIAWEAQRNARADAGPIYVLLRYDDYSHRSQESVDEAVIDSFRRHGAPVTVAVIPCPADSFAPARVASCDEPLDASKAEILVRAHREGVAEIALHGYSHASAEKMPFESEFYGVAPAEQRRRIGLGLDEVERRTGVRPSTFVPPFDSYDAATLEAIEALGMRTISGGMGPSSGEQLAFIPNTVYIKQIREAVLRLKDDGDAGAVIVSIFHPWDMEEADQMVPLTGSSYRPLNLKQLDAILDWLRQQPEVRLTTMQALSASGVDLGAQRFARAREYYQSVIRRMPPPSLRRPISFGLQSVERYRQLEVESWLRVSTYCLTSVVLVSGLVVGVLRFVRSRRKPVAPLAWLAMGLGAAVLLAGPQLMGTLAWKDFAALLIALGMSLGGALSLLEVRGSRTHPST